MTLLYTPAQLEIINESRVFWNSKKAPRIQTCCLVAGEGGETGYKWSLVNGVMRTPAGDHGMAEGVFQWWPERAALILKHTGRDVREGSHLDMLAGAYAEMTEAWSPYRHVWDALMAAKTIWAGTEVLVDQYERSKNQASDILKRTGIAGYMDHIFPAEVTA